MKIYTQYNSYGYDEFDENQKWSCHSWLFKCIDDINDTFNIVKKNQSYLNEKDLVGKYNALNYLLDIYSFHQSSGLRKYSKDRNIQLDFCIILYALINEGADIDSADYERKKFINNLNDIFTSEKELSWKQKYKFLSDEAIQLIYSRNKKDILKAMLKNEERPIYLGLSLELSLSVNQNKDKKFKM